MKIAFFLLSAFLAVNTFAATSGSVTVDIDATSVRTIRLGEFAKSQLDRDKYFRTYHIPGLFSEDISEDLKEIGAIPARGTGPYYSFDKQHSFDSSDLSSDGVNFQKWVDKQNQKYCRIYKTAAERYPNIKHALAFNPNYPETMRRGNEGKDKGILKSECYDDFSNLIVAFYDELKAQGCSIPLWYTTQNEPPYQWGAEEFAKYSRVMAKSMAKKHPEVKVCGPCSAWPYPQTDWRRWNGWEKKFIEIAGKDIGAYDLHFYSKGYWAYSDERLMGDPLSKRQSSPSLYVSQKKGCPTVWDYGRMDGLLDLFAAYHSGYHNSTPKPMIVSEFGRQGVEPQLGPWENDFKPWLYMTTVVRMWMSFMERPEVELAVPFILGQADMVYGANRGQAVYNRPGAPEDKSCHVTRFREFYSFFKDLQGKRIIADVKESRDVLARAFLEGNTVYVLLHNGKGYLEGSAVIDMNIATVELDVVSSQIKRLGWHGAVPQDHSSRELEGKLVIDTENDYHQLDDLSAIALDGEETAIVKLILSDSPKTKEVVEYIDYSKNSLLSVNKEGKCRLSVATAVRDGELKQASLYMAFAVDAGFVANPTVRLNGKELDGFDVTFSQGIKDFHCPVKIQIPVELLRRNNSIDVLFDVDTMKNVSEVKIVTAKIITSYYE